MDEADFSVVTGALGYTGRYITERLLAKGEHVRTLTNRPARTNPFGDRISIAPYDFDDPPALVASLRGATTLYNTYWARFSYGKISYDQAVRNSHILISAAKEAGLRRIVQITVTNASEESRIPYFRGKAQIERAVVESGISYAILRPCMIFGPGGILVNDIAWLLRHFPLFAVPGSGLYRISPIFVGDLADLAVHAAQGLDNETTDAVGPETLTFNELVAIIKSAIGSRALIVHTHPRFALFMAGLAGRLVGDIVLQQWEIDAMLTGLLSSESPPSGQTRLSDWLRQNAPTLGIRYYSELQRNYAGR